VESGDRELADTAISWSNLTRALITLFEETGKLADLEAAIEAGRTAAAMPGDASVKAGALSNLGAMLRARYRHTGEPANLDEAVSLSREAVAGTSADHPDRPMYLSGLGTSLRHRYARIGAQADLDAAVEVCEEAARTIPGGPPRPGGLPVQARERPAEPLREVPVGGRPGPGDRGRA
jgi:hypothetical protein